MKRAAVICYTDRGAETAAKIAKILQDSHAVEQYRSKCRTGDLFSACDALVFVGACGIAVRAIAPFIRSKTTDPAVIVADERGRNIISLLSGHIGGANELTRRIASALGGNPVITTATDVNGRFAVDEWAAKRGLAIQSMQAAKKFAAEILKRDLPLHCDFPVSGALPGGLYAGDAGECGLAVSCRNIHPFDTTVLLTPRILHMGVGCKRGASAEKIRAAVESALQVENICHAAIASAASIDVKRDEAGLLEFCREAQLPVQFYSAQALWEAPGEYSASAFVQGTVGVDNVCERAAMLRAGAGAKLIIRKTCLNGVTVAVAQEKWSVCFE